MSSINRPFAAAPRAWKENQAHEIARRAGPSHDLNQSAGQLRAGLTKRGIEPVIPPRSNRKTPIEYDHEAYKRRNLIERCVNRLKPFRRIATRYEKTARAYLSMLCIAVISDRKLHGLDRVRARRIPVF